MSAENRHLRSRRKGNGTQRRTKASFSRTMMQALNGAAAVGKKVYLMMKLCGTVRQSVI